MMTVEKGTSAPDVYVIADDDDAVFVIYAAKELNGAANKDDIVYLDDDCDTRLSSSTYEGTLWFMKDLSDKDVSIDDDGKTKQGFYKFSIDSDGVYKLDNTDGLSAGEVNDNDDGFAENVVFETGKSTSLTSASKNTSVDGTEYYNNVQFVGTSMKNATVIDTRGSSDRSDDASSTEINTTSKLVSALDKGLVVADVYVDDGEIIFVAVKECEDAGNSGSSSSSATRFTGFGEAKVSGKSVDITLNTTTSGTKSGTVTVTLYARESSTWAEWDSYTVTLPASSDGIETLTIDGLSAGSYRATCNGYTVNFAIG